MKHNLIKIPYKWKVEITSSIILGITRAGISKHKSGAPTQKIKNIDLHLLLLSTNNKRYLIFTIIKITIIIIISQFYEQNANIHMTYYTYYI